MLLNSVVGRRLCSTVDLKASVRYWVQLEMEEWLPISGKRHQTRHLDSWPPPLLTEGLVV